MIGGIVLYMKTVNIYSDGSCIRNPGVGAWATILEYNGKEKILSGYDFNTTNNRMELLGVINGLEALKEPCNVEIFTDSKYVTDAFNQKWIDNWVESGILKRKNGELWARLLDASKNHRVTYNWIKGHAGNPYNERCDKIANSLSRQYSTD